MAKFELAFKKSALKDLLPLPSVEVRRILEAIEGLKEDPRPPQSQKLSGSEKYRLRKGKYRILYQIEDQVLVITVVKIAHRRDIYS